MNYQESKQILEEINKAKRILLNCHRGPDPDSIGSALAMYHILKKIRKDVVIVCPSEQLYDNVSFLKGYRKIKKNVNFLKFDYSDYDLFIALDSSDPQMITRSSEIPLPKIPLIVLDHHITNPGYGDINLIDPKASSVGEILYLIFRDWDIEIDKSVADCLMTAIIGDTGAFRFNNVTPKTFKVVGNLMKIGADKDRIIFQIYHSEGFDLLKFYAEVLSRMQIDNIGNFVWSSIPFEIYDQLTDESKSNEKAASVFAQKVKDTEFGLVMVETEKNKLGVSFRSRTGFDTSKIAVELGGGGHVYASGANVEGVPFDKAVEKVLGVVRKHVRKYQKTNSQGN